MSEVNHLPPTGTTEVWLLQPDLNGLNDIMSLLREKPMLQSDVLQPLLAKYLPFYAATDSMFIVKFHLQAQHW
jgi:hypothetical protein